MRLEKKKEGKTTVIKILESRVDILVADELKRELGDLIRRGNTSLILNLSKVEYMDSSGLAAIVSNYRSLSGKGSLVLCNTQDKVKTLFEVTKLNEVFKIFGSEKEAVALLETK